MNNQSVTVFSADFVGVLREKRTDGQQARAARRVSEYMSDTADAPPYQRGIVKRVNPDIEILRVCLGLDWVNYRTAASRAEKRLRRKLVRETIALLRRHQGAA